MDCGVVVWYVCGLMGVPVVAASKTSCKFVGHLSGGGKQIGLLLQFPRTGRWTTTVQTTEKDVVVDKTTTHPTMALAAYFRMIAHMLPRELLHMAPAAQPPHHQCCDATAASAVAFAVVFINAAARGCMLVAGGDPATFVVTVRGSAAVFMFGRSALTSTTTESTGPPVRTNYPAGCILAPGAYKWCASQHHQIVLLVCRVMETTLWTLWKT